MNELDVAVQAAQAAAAILRAHAEGPQQVTHKGRVDLVTEVDLACEDAIRAVLTHHTPNIPVLGEEGGGDESIGTRWVVDPLDGTTNFVHGYPFYCTSVALEVDFQPVAAAIIDPIRSVLYAAAKGQGAHRNSKPMRVSDCRTLDAALVGTGFSYDRRDRPDFYLEPFKRVMCAVQGLRRGGAAALELAQLADGRLDAFWEYNLKRWDVAAGALLITEAGGRIEHMTGGAMQGLHVHPVAANGWLLDALRSSVLGESID